MKKLITVIVLAMVGLTSCKKEAINPKITHSTENTVEDTSEDNDPHISDSMVYVSINVKTLSVSVGLNVNNDDKDYAIYSVSEDSSVYVSNGWNISSTGGSISWSGWIKPESEVTISGSYSGGSSNYFDFDITVQVDNGTPVTNNFSITPSNKNYSAIFYVK